MRDMKLLQELLEAETEEAVILALDSRGLLSPDSRKARWRYLGEMPNNQSIVQAQQSSPAAALIEKFTNSGDAILLRYCKAAGIDPRSEEAPQSMAEAVDRFLGTKAETFSRAIESPDARNVLRQFAEENLVLYATGTKARPSIALYDNGEGQLAKDFPGTFCSLIHGSGGGSYKGAIPFVQGRFNMGSSGVLPFCSEKYKMQLIVSRVPPDVAGGDDHEWAFTVLCYFSSKQDPSWHYLVGPDGHVLTAGSQPLALVPRAGAKSGEITPPRERAVPSGTLVKMYDFKAPRSNVCGELFKRIEEFMLRPPLPIRIVECRPEYRANVMRVTVWDRLGSWGKDRLEPGFEDGASITVQLETGESIPVEIRVFKAQKKVGRTSDDEADQPQTGLRAIINGQSHARRDAQFFRTQAVDKEHIAGSMLVLLDCTSLGQDSRNALFMSNREIFREDPLLMDLFKKVQRELKSHEGLIELNRRRYEEKVRDAVNDEDGVKALEELLKTDKDLAGLFGTMFPGAVAAKLAKDGEGSRVPGSPEAFCGEMYPTFFERDGGETTVDVSIGQGELGRVAFRTDVKNEYFTRKRARGAEAFSGDVVPTSRLFNGKYTLTYSVDRSLKVGTRLASHIIITDSKGSGPFALDVNVTVSEPTQKKEPGTPRPPSPPKAAAGPSRPDIQEVRSGPDGLPLMIEAVPDSERLKLLLNVESKLLAQAKEMRPKEEEPAVEFVFKYGLALTAMGLLEAVKKTPDWGSNPADCRSRIQDTAVGIARVIVPLCLSLPKKLPKSRAATT